MTLERVVGHLKRNGNQLSTEFTVDTFPEGTRESEFSGRNVMGQNSAEFYP